MWMWQFCASLASTLELHMLRIADAFVIQSRAQGMASLHSFSHSFDDCTRFRMCDKSPPKSHIFFILLFDNCPGRDSIQKFSFSLALDLFLFICFVDPPGTGNWEILYQRLGEVICHSLIAINARNWYKANIRRDARVCRSLSSTRGGGGAHKLTRAVVKLVILDLSTLCRRSWQWQRRNATNRKCIARTHTHTFPLFSGSDNLKYS